MDNEYRITLPNGKIRWIKSLGKATYDKDGKAIRMSGICIDLTHDKIDDIRLNKLNRTLKALSNSNQVLLDASDERSYLKNICDIVVEICGYPMVWIGYANSDEEKSVQPVAFSGFEDGYLETLNITWADSERGHGPTGTAIRTGQPCGCSNMMDDPAFEPWRKEALARGYASSLSLPLRHNDLVIGAITIYSAQPDVFSQDEIELLQELAEDVANGIFFLRIRDAKDQTEEELRKTNQRLAIISYTANRLLTTEAPRLVVQDLCQRVMKFLDCQVFFNYLIDEKTNRLHLNASHGASEETTKALEWFNLGEAICGCVARDGSQIIVDHVQESSDPRAKIVKSFGIRAYACHPLLEHSQILGTLAFGTNRRDSFSKEDLTLMRAVTDQVAISMIRMRSEEALRESEERFRKIADTMPNLVWTAKPDGNIEYANLVFHDYTGIAKTNGPAWNVLPLSANDRRLMEVTRKRAAKLGRPYQLEQKIRRSDGNWRWHLTRCVPIVNDGVIVKWYGTATDIDDIKIAAEKLREADEEKSKFISTMSHELRNPLTPIVTGIELVKSYLDQEPQAAQSSNDAIIRESVSIIDQQASHMARLLDDMLDISRISRGKIQLKKQPVSLRDSLEHAIEVVMPLLRSQNHQFATILPEASLLVLADPVRLQQIFVNLLNNAIKYTPPNGQIWLEASQTGDFAQITVRDTGLGIDKEKIESIFSSYGNSRGVTPFVSTQGELGIGLKLTKDLVSLHGGTISAISAGKDQGCEFTVRLRALPTGQGSKPGNIPNGGQTAKPAAALRALVVDDNAGAADMTAKALSFFGHEAKVCYDARSAIEMANTYRPHIMFIDIEMPGMNGYDLADTLRKTADRSLKQVKLVAVTGYGQKEDKERALSAGFDLHLAKPVSMQILRKAISDLIPDGTILS